MAYLQLVNKDVWLDVEDGWTHPTKKEGNAPDIVDLLKPRREWTPEEKKVTNHNSRALYVIFATVNENENNRVQGCELAQEA